MIRFEPDTLRDALLRPLAMMAPDAGVYAEIQAPDWRFGFALLLAAIVIVARWRTLRESPALAALCVWMLGAFAAWLATSGNGRYFMPGLLVIGPLCIALAYRLPGTRALRLATAVLAVGLQMFLLATIAPWNSWGFARWAGGSYFPVALDEEARTQPTTYVTVSSISYSLIAPQFPAQSRWMNTSALPDASETQIVDVVRAQAMLRESKSLHFIAPSRPDLMDAGQNPNAELAAEIDKMLNGQRLALERPLRCRLLPSEGMAAIALKHPEKADPRMKARLGFWVCPLRYPVPRMQPPAQEHGDVEDVFAQVEKQCPRFFAPGQKGVGRAEDAWVRYYPQSDMRLYLWSDGQVYYKYLRALNPVHLGSAEQVRSGAPIDCNTIRGRTGLPWEREI